MKVRVYWNLHRKMWSVQQDGLVVDHMKCVVLEDAKFVIPYIEVGILIIITVVASILASVIPANEASKTYPAEALRYE